MLGEGGDVAYQLSPKPPISGPKMAYHWTPYNPVPELMADTSTPEAAEVRGFGGIVSISGTGTVFGRWTKEIGDAMDDCLGTPEGRLVYPWARWNPYWAPERLVYGQTYQAAAWPSQDPEVLIQSERFDLLLDRNDYLWSTDFVYGTKARPEPYMIDCPFGSGTYTPSKVFASGGLSEIVHAAGVIDTSALSLASRNTLDAALRGAITSPPPAEPATVSGGESMAFLTANDTGGFLGRGRLESGRTFLSEVDPTNGVRVTTEITAQFPPNPDKPSPIVALSNDGVILTENWLAVKDANGTYQELTPSQVRVSSDGDITWADFNSDHTAVGGQAGGRAVVMINDKVYDLASLTGGDPTLDFTFAAAGPVPQLINDKGMIVAVANTSPNGAIVLLVPVQMTWESAPWWDGRGNVSDNKSPVNFKYKLNSTMRDGRWLPGRGRRIFAEAIKSIGFSRNRALLRIQVPSGFASDVFLKSFDVDDATDEDFDQNLDRESIIDTNGKSGNDNKDETWPKSGQFIINGSAAGTTRRINLTAEGNAEALFETTKQPGDNFRVALAFKQASLNSLQVDNSNAAGFIPSGSEEWPSGFEGIVSPLLTVWRTLHIEEDTMAQIPVQGSEKNFELGIIDSVTQHTGKRFTLTLSLRLSGGLHRFAGGTMRIGSWRFKVMGNEHLSTPHDNVEILDDDANHLASAHAAGNVKDQAFLLVDDDDLPKEFRLPLSNSLITDTVISKFIPAYVELKVASNRKRILPFMLNTFPPHPTPSDIRNTDEFWSHRVIASYQPPALGPLGPDGDPDTEFGPSDIGDGPTGGLTFRYAMDSLIYLETLRDFYNGRLAGGSKLSDEIYGVVAHEIGHGPGGATRPDDHLEEGLMQGNAGSIDMTFFSPKTILRFRKATRW